MRFRKAPQIKLTTAEVLALAKRQREYQQLVTDFCDEVINLIGGVDGRKARRRAVQEMASDVADTIASFIIRHTETIGMED